MGVLDLFKRPVVQTVTSIEQTEASTEKKSKMSQDEKERLIVEQATIEAMEQFSFLPFIFSGRKMERNYAGHPTAFINLDRQNIAAAKIELDNINEYIKKSPELSDLIPLDICIPIDKVEYKQYNKSYGYSKLICTPYTATGKQAKYPLKFLFMTRLDNTSYVEEASGIIRTKNTSTHGEIIYGVDGRPATAKINFWRDGIGYFYEFKTVGRTFLINKIKCTMKTDERGLPAEIYKFQI